MRNSELERAAQGAVVDAGQAAPLPDASGIEGRKQNFLPRGLRRGLQVGLAGASIVTGTAQCVSTPTPEEAATSPVIPVERRETIPPKPITMDAFPSVPATGEQGPTERYPWIGSSKIKLEYNPAKGGDNQNIQPAGEITLPESVVGDIVAAAAKGRIVNRSGKPVVGIESQAWVLVGYRSFGADGKERQWAVAYSAQSNDLLLPFKYQTKDKGAVTVLAFISPEPKEELWVYPDLGVAVRESDPNYGPLDKAIFRREIKGSFGEGKPIAINPEAFPPSLHFSGLTEAEASKPVSYFVEKEKPDGTVTYEQRTWNPTVDPRKDPSQAIPESLEVLAMETGGKKEWVKVVLTGPTGQPEIAFVKWATSLELVGDASQIRPLTEIPAELRAFQENSQIPDAFIFTGLHLERQGEKWIYATEKGEKAGDLIEFTYSSEKMYGAILIPKTWQLLEPEFNTPEALAKGKWFIPVPLDARNEKNLIIKPWKPGILTYVFLTIENLSPNAALVSPFTESVSRDYNANSPGFGGGCDVGIPPRYVNGRKDNALMFVVPIGGYVPSRGSSGLGSKVIEGITGVLGPRAPQGVRAIIGIGPGPTLEEGEDIDITRHIAARGNTMVFLGAKQ